MEKVWSLIQNVFETCTRHNYLKMSIIASFTDEVLFGKISDPFFSDLYDEYHPDAEAYEGAYDAWESQLGSQKSGTTALRNKLSDLSHPFIGQVDVAIQMVYPKGSPRYIELLPNGRGPFQTGRISQRIHALHALRIAIGTDAALIPVRDMVQTFIDETNALKTDHSGDLQDTKDDSHTVETKRLLMADRMQWLYGNLTVKYYNDMPKVGTFFDQINIRNHNQVQFNRHIAPHTSKTLCRHLFHNGDQTLIEVNAPSALRFGLTLTKNETVTGGYLRNPGPGATIDANDLGNLANPYITVTNNTDVEGSFSFTLL